MSPRGRHLLGILLWLLALAWLAWRCAIPGLSVTCAGVMPR